MLLLGIDAGTSMIKCALFDLAGNEILVVRKRVPTTSQELGWAEQDMNLIKEATFSAVKEIVAFSRTRNDEIAGVGITGQSAGTFIVDNEIEPVKAILWRDTRAKSLVREWTKRGLDKRFQELTGWPLLPDFAPIQLAWIKEHDPKTLERAKWVFGCIDWIAYCLTSKVRAVSTAMIACINPESRTYDSKILELLGQGQYSHLFPELIDPWEVVGEISNEASRATGLTIGVPVVSAGYDQTCNTLGAGGVEPGGAVTVLGTAGGNALVTGKYVDPTGSFISCTPHAAPNRWIMLGESHTATPNLDWFIAQFCREEIAEAETKRLSVYKVCDEKIKSVPPGSGGILYQPYLYGEVSPFFESNAKSTFFGINGSHSKFHLLRAVYEGVGYSVRDNYETMKELTSMKIHSIALAGGGAKSQIWAQMLADINKCEVRVTNAAEIGCKGAVICAANGMKLFENVEAAAKSMVRTVAVYQPHESESEVYDTMYSGYRKLREALRPLWNMQPSSSSSR